MKKTAKQYKTRTVKGHILGLIESLKPGESFLTTDKPATCQTYAQRYGKAIQTKIVYNLDLKSGIIKKITKVTVLGVLTKTQEHENNPNQ